MKVLEIAEIYKDLADIESQIPAEEFHAKEQINLLKAKYHQFLMDQMRIEGIFFADRFDATKKAFELIDQEKASNN